MNNERRRESREPTQVQRLFRQLVREWLWISLLLLPLTGLLSFNAETSHRNGSGAGGALVSVCLVAWVLGFIPASGVVGMWNEVWHVERRRSIGQRFVVFYSLITIAPALVGVSLFHLARVGLTQGFIGALGALASTWAALVFANKLLPATRVEWRAALVGGLVSALLFEVAKHLFSIYVAEIAFKKYAGMYGALGLIPILLVWIYYTWLVVLFGAEIAYAVQHLSELELFDRRAHNLEAEVLDRVNGLVAARFMIAVVEAWERGAPMTREALGRKLHLATETSERIARRLRDRKLIVELDGDPPAFVPARTPAEITLADVFAPFRGQDVVTPAVRAASKDPVDQALARLEQDRTASLASVTIESLVREESAAQKPG